MKTKVTQDLGGNKVYFNAPANTQAVIIASVYTAPYSGSIGKMVFSSTKALADYLEANTDRKVLGKFCHNFQVKPGRANGNHIVEFIA